MSYFSQTETRSSTELRRSLPTNNHSISETRERNLSEEWAKSPHSTVEEIKPDEIKTEPIVPSVEKKDSVVHHPEDLNKNTPIIIGATKNLTLYD